MESSFYALQQQKVICQKIGHNQQTSDTYNGGVMLWTVRFPSPLLPCQKHSVRRGHLSGLHICEKHTIPLQNGLCLKHTLLGLKPNTYLFPVLVLNRKKHSHRCRLRAMQCGYLIFIYHTFHKMVPVISSRKGNHIISYINKYTET